MRIAHPASGQYAITIARASVFCRTRPADHVLDESSTLQGSPDPLEVSHVRTNACIDRNASLPAVP